LKELAYSNIDQERQARHSASGFAGTDGPAMDIYAKEKKS